MKEQLRPLFKYAGYILITCAVYLIMNLFNMRSLEVDAESILFVTIGSLMLAVIIWLKNADRTVIKDTTLDLLSKIGRAHV